MAFFSVADAFSSFVCGKASKKFGRNPTMFAGMILDTGLYLACLLWQPEKQMLQIVYALFVLAGFADAVWKTTVGGETDRFLRAVLWCLPQNKIF